MNGYMKVLLNVMLVMVFAVGCNKRKQIEEHCRIVCRFFNWKEVIILRKGDVNFV